MTNEWNEFNMLWIDFELESSQRMVFSGEAKSSQLKCVTEDFCEFASYYALTLTLIALVNVLSVTSKTPPNDQLSCRKSLNV